MRAALGEARQNAERSAIRRVAGMDDRIDVQIPGLTFEEFRDADRGPDSGWCDAFRVRDGRVVLSTGAVHGTGIGAASAMFAVRQVVRGVASVHPEPRMILDAVERTLDGGALHGAASVSAWIGVLDPLDLQLQYASAGHPAPLLRGDDTVVRPLTPGESALGIGSRRVRSVHSVALAPGSALLLSTDGLIEAGRDVIRHQAAVKDAFARLDGSAAPDTMREMAAGGRATTDAIALLYVGIERAGALGDGILTWTFDARDALEGRRIRHAFVDALRACNYPDDAVFNAELVFGELLGNVVRHAGGQVEIRFDGSLPDAVLHVLDEGRGFARNPKLSDAWAEGGRGLALIEFLVDDFSVSHRPQRGAHARAVLRRTGAVASHAIASAGDGRAWAEG